MESKLLPLRQIVSLSRARPVRAWRPVAILVGFPGILWRSSPNDSRHLFAPAVESLAAGGEGPLFYSPAAWRISRTMRSEPESRYDDAAAAMSGDAHICPVALARLGENCWSGRGTAVTATGGNLAQRIRRQLYFKGPTGAWTLLIAAVSFVATAVMALAAWQSEPPRQSSAPAQKQTDRAGTSPYVKWLNEDVVYIVAKEERAAFLKLTTNEEREKFVEPF